VNTNIIVLPLQNVIESNMLNGGVPPELGRLGKLKVLSIAGNTLDGPLPLEIGNLTELESLNLGEFMQHQWNINTIIEDDLNKLLVEFI